MFSTKPASNFAVSGYLVPSTHLPYDPPAFPIIGPLPTNGFPYRAVDDAMGPDIRRGELMLMDPDLQPRQGDTVLVRDRCGDMHLRLYQRTVDDDFNAVARNDWFSNLECARDGLTVVAVMFIHYIGRASERPSCRGIVSA